FALAAIREKARRLAWRYALMGLGMMWTAWQGLARVPALAAALVIVPVVAALFGVRAAVRPVALPAPGGAPRLPSRLGAGVAGLVQTVPAIGARRHRGGLRAVLQRLLALQAAVPPEEAARLDADLAQVLDLATAAALRVDELERRLAAV